MSIKQILTPKSSTKKLAPFKKFKIDSAMATRHTEKRPNTSRMKIVRRNSNLDIEKEVNLSASQLHSTTLDLTVGSSLEMTGKSNQKKTKKNLQRQLIEKICLKNDQTQLKATKKLSINW